MARQQKIERERKPATTPSKLWSEEAGERTRATAPAFTASAEAVVRTPGEALPVETRMPLERQFGHDFSQVRIHADQEAARSAESLDARAYTVGRDIVFGATEYAPGTPEGQQLIAHELTHVVQQRAASPPQAGISLPISQPADQGEIEAGQAASAVDSGAGESPVTVRQALTSPAIQRQRGGSGGPKTANPPPRTAGGTGSPPRDDETKLDPQLRPAESMVEFTNLNAEISHDVNVSNAGRLPAGTQFNWRWARGFDSEKLEDRGAQPADSPRAALKARVKKVFESAQMTPELQYTLAGSPTAAKQGAPIDITVMQPEAQWISLVASGSLAPSRERDTERFFVGDTLTIAATFENVNDARNAGIEFLALWGGVQPGAATLRISQARWEDATTAVWDVQADGAGSAFLSISAFVPGLDEPLAQSFKILAVTDARHFKDRCTTAHAHLDAAYAAGEEFFLTCSQNYKAGYEAHKKALDDQSERDRLTQELILGILFAGISGAAGGAVGGAMANAGLKIAKATSNAMAGAITDTAKDLTKYVTRIPAIVAGRGGSGGGQSAPGGQVEMDRQSRQAGVTGRGQYGAAASDPFGWFLDVQRAFSGEKREAFEQLRLLQEAADRVLSTDEQYEFDWDPVELVTNTALIDNTPLGSLGEPPSADDYEKVFWAVWLSQYAWKLGHITMPGDGPSTSKRYYHPEENIGKDLKKEINRVARKFNESGEEWIARYGADSRAAVAEQASRLN